MKYVCIFFFNKTITCLTVRVLRYTYIYIYLYIFITMGRIIADMLGFMYVCTLGDCMYNLIYIHIHIDLFTLYTLQYATI